MTQSPTLVVQRWQQASEMICNAFAIGKILCSYLQHQSTIILPCQEKQQVQSNPQVPGQDAFLPPEGTAVFRKEGSLAGAFASYGVTLVCLFFSFRSGFKGVGMCVCAYISPKKSGTRSILPIIQSLQF